MRPKLKKGDISIKEIYEISKLYYRTPKPKGDNKRSRMKLDVLSGTLQARKNYQYDRSKREWVQTGREVLFTFLVRTRPISYKKIDALAIHKYPVFFLVKDVTLGLDSPFRWREGGLKRPLFPRRGMDAKQRKIMATTNVRNQVQLDFFFKNMALCEWLGLLWGVNTTNKRLPTKANPTMTPYFGKHALKVIELILIPLLTRAEGRAALQAKNII